MRIPSRSALRWLDVELSPVENGSSLVVPSAAAFSRRQASSAAVYVVVGPIVGNRATKPTVTTTEPAASTAGDVTHTLIVSDDEGVQQRVPVSVAPLTIGRVPPSDLVLADSSVSRTHCQVRLVEGQAMAADLRSTNGTFVDGRRIAEATPLQHGSVLQVGSFTLLYERRTRSEIEETAAIERDHVRPEARLQRRVAVELVEHHLRHGVALDLDHDAIAVAIGFIA